MQQCVELLIEQLGQYLNDLYIMGMAYQCTWLPNMISHHQHHHPYGRQRLLHTRFERIHVNQTHGAEPPSLSLITYQQKRFILATR
jgi:hypothetical protein